MIFPQEVWVETNGNDATGAVGNPALPFATLNAALTASAPSPTVLHIGMGTFAPVTDDRNPGNTLNPASVLRSGLWFKGAKRASPNAGLTGYTAGSGTVIQGRLNFNSTRDDIVVSDLSIDSGSDVCTALYGGVAQEGLIFNNITQTPGAAQGKRVYVYAVSVLCKSAASAVHATLIENYNGFGVDDLEVTYGTHGLAVKSQHGTVNGVISRGHSGDVLICKDGGGGLDVGPCHDVVITNVVGGPVLAGDTPTGVILESGSANTLQRVVISGVTLEGVTTDLKTDLTGAAAVCVANCRVDNLVTQNGTPVTSLQATTDLQTVRLNGVPLAGDGPAFSAYASVNQAGIVAGSFTKVNFGTTEYNAYNCYAGGRFTPTVPGVYQINASVYCNPSGAYARAILYKNGVANRTGDFFAGVVGNSCIATLSTQVYLNGSTDYVEVFVNPNGACTVDGSGVSLTCFNGALVRSN